MRRRPVLDGEQFRSPSIVAKDPSPGRGPERKIALLVALAILAASMLAEYAFAQDAPGKRADGVYVWSLRRGCTGTARRIARGAVDPDWGPR